MTSTKTLQTQSSKDPSESAIMIWIWKLYTNWYRKYCPALILTAVIIVFWESVIYNFEFGGC